MKDYKMSITYFRKAVDLKLKGNTRKTILLKILLYYNYHNAWDYVLHYSNKYLKLDPKNKDVNKMRERAIANRGKENSNIANVKIPDKSSSKEEGKKNTSEQKEKEVKKEESPKEKKEPKTNPVEKFDPSEIWEEALEAFNKEQYDKSDKLLSDLLSKFPEDVNYLYKLGVTKHRIGKFSESLELLSGAESRTKPGDKQMLYYIHLNKGNAYHKLNKLEKAADSYSKALENNNAPLALLALIKVNYERGKFKEALEDSENLLADNPDSLEAALYNSILELQLGNKIRGYKLLLNFQKKLLEKYPDYKEVPEKFHTGFLYLGVFYSGRIKYNRALKYLEMVKKTRSEYKSYNFALAKSYFYKEKYDKALPILKKMDKVAAAQFLIAKYYAKQKDISKTKLYIKKAGKLKELYWIKLKIDNSFNEVLKDQSFYDFVNNRGESKESDPAVKEKVEVKKIDSSEKPIEKEKSEPTSPPVDLDKNTETGKTETPPKSQEKE